MIRMIVSSDTHCGSLFGLTPPGYFGGNPQAKQIQMKLWRWWKKEIQRIGPVDVWVHNGDAVDGPGRKETTEHLTTDIDEQVDMAVAALKIIDAENKYMTYGTPYHVKGETKYEKPVAAELGADLAVEQLIQVGPYKFSFRHHQGRSDTPSGQFHQTFKNIVRDSLRSSYLQFDGADVTIRSHVHYYARAENRFKIALSTPCLEFPFGSYGWKLQTMLYDMGFLFIEIDDKTNEIFIRPRLVPDTWYNQMEYKRAV